MGTDRIEKKRVLAAPRARVWRAIADAAEFGSWFGIKLEGPFAPARRMTGRITTKGYEHLTMEMVVERMEPEKLFSYRWHPYAVDPKVDYSKEPMTLVEIHLGDAPGGGTEITVVETGFDAIPLARRAEAFRMNEHGWAEQLANIARHVAA
jgi:uncharacterized protein YndB with AHSA1/START domain